MSDQGNQMEDLDFKRWPVVMQASFRANELLNEAETIEDCMALALSFVILMAALAPDDTMMSLNALIETRMRQKQGIQ